MGSVPICCTAPGPTTAERFFIDDDLVEMFSDPKWTNVNKVFMIEGCFSGGFWGGGDEGDLEKLSKTVLLASSQENQYSYFLPSNVPY